ncbi:cupin domain-containing protein [Cupriavidus sp. 2TAF22]|uniref:cupin domain-containing protein n=1 Tax=unclassified Cupriavidus TaxID=2640874 RepID=UPI003F8DC155
MSQVALHYRWSERPSETILGGITRRFITSERMMIGEVTLRKGDLVPLHAHPNEQFTFVVRGAMRFWLDETNEHGVLVEAGEVVVIPANTPHRAEVLEDTLEYDIFTPPRGDWIDGDSPLLRDLSPSGVPSVRSE